MHIKKNDIVYDKKNKNEGKVVSIERATSMATIEMVKDISLPKKEWEIVEYKTNLYNLIPLKKKRKEPVKPAMSDAVLEFQKTFEAPIGKVVAPLEVERGLARTNWTGEELVEYLHALSYSQEEFHSLANKFIDSLKEQVTRMAEKEIITDSDEKAAAQLDAIGDGLVFLVGTAIETGELSPEEIVKIIHQSNMSKLFTDENGKKYVVKRESDGKVVKSENFFAPEGKIIQRVKKLNEQKTFNSFN